MAIFLDSVSCPDAFGTDRADAALGPLFRSNGGFFSVSGNDVYCQLGYAPPGVQDLVWTDAAHISIGASGAGATGVLLPGTAGIRFRNYTAGKTAVVSAGLYSNSEPSLQLTTGGVGSSVSVSGMVEIASTTLSGSGNVTFSNIPQTYQHLKLVALAVGTGAETALGIEFNGDSGLNYSYSANEILNGAANFSDGSGVSSGLVGAIGSAGASAFEILVPGYAQTALFHRYVSSYSMVATSIRSGVYGGSWASTAAITSLSLVASGGCGARTIVTLYGL